MLKILSIFAIFFSTGFFLLQVDNLTQKKDLNSSLNLEPNLNSKNQDKINFSSKEGIIFEEKSKGVGIEKKIEGDIKENFSAENNNFNGKLPQKKKPKDKIFTKKFSVQFGAFSKEIGAKTLKNKVDMIIKPKFDFFESKIQYNEKKKIYFLKFDSDSEENVNQTCKFSRSNEIDCYVIQR